MSKLIILESPVKVKTFKKYLNDDYVVIGTAGHIMDLNKKELSINLENFEPIYELHENKMDIINNIKKILKKVDTVYIATDYDREGEAIGYNVKTHFKIKNAHRIIFNSITKKDILNAIENPTKLEMNIVYAQQTRRIIDRLFGFLISPILPNGKSCGRVQSNIVKIIIDKEKEIEKYKNSKQETFYNIFCDLQIGEIKFNTKLINNSENSSSSKFETENKDILINISKSKLELSDLDIVEIKNNPNEPFITTTLQQYASTHLKINTKLTMEIAQKLYESGYITYIRTDSVYMCDEAIQNIKTFVIQTYGKNYYKKTIYENKNENAQNAHECIRPTNIELIEIEGSDLEQKIYYSIWKRTIQSQMKPAIYQQINITISMDKLQDYILKGKKEILIFEGYLLLDGKKPDSKYENDLKLEQIDWLKIESCEDIKKQPLRFDESSLIKYLSDLSIIRPSTASSSLITPIERGYLKIENIDGINKELNTFTILKENPETISNTHKSIKIGNEKNKYIPTQLGIETTDFLEKNFSLLLDKNFTIKMEKDLDDIANGLNNKIEIIKPFYEYIYEKSKTMSSNKIIGYINKIPVEFIQSNKFGNFIKYENDKINIQELYEEKMPTDEEIINYIKPKISRNIGKINNVDVILKNGMHGYYCVCDINIDINDFYDENKTNDEILNYVKNKIPINIGKLNNFDVLLKNGSNGKYIKYNENNYNVDFMFINKTPTNEELLDYLKNKIENLKFKKEWIIKKNKYVLKKGPYGFYLENYENDVKQKNININKYFEENLKTKTIEEILSKLTKKELLLLIEKK